MFNTPILLVTWNRPFLVPQLIDSLKIIKPLDIYIASDGPRRNIVDEACLVSTTRTLLEVSIDWQCTIHKRYSDYNQGCRLGVSNAITWFFSHVDEGIILEDDCIPNTDFFYFCRQMLQLYRHDDRIGCISGNNLIKNHKYSDTYIFSRIPLIWGWATWRRAWQHYSPDLPAIVPYTQLRPALDSVLPSYLHFLYWFRIYKRMYLTGKPDTWDYQWTLICLLNNFLTILPPVNLIMNVGFGPTATHTYSSSYDQVASAPLPILRQRRYVHHCRKIEDKILAYHLVSPKKSFVLRYIFYLRQMMTSLPHYLLSFLSQRG